VEAGLSEVHGRKLEYQEIACLMGRSTSTAFGWLAGANMQQVESAIRLLEQLPGPMRQRILNQLYRCLPTLEDDRLAWSETQVSGLHQLLRQTSALTFLQGDESASGFVISALGHSCWRAGLNSKPVRGLDVRSPERLVAVPGVLYLNQPSTSEQLRDLARKGWAAIRQAKNHLILLNGIWHAMPELQPEVLRLSKQCHVVVADHRFLAGTGMKDARVDGPRLVVTAIERPDNRIQVEFQPA
jgi:hypothetical protein